MIDSFPLDRSMPESEGILRIDQTTIRNERLARLQAAMSHLDIGVLILTSPPHIRFATGTSCMPIWTALNLARYAIVPVTGEPVLFEYGKALFLARGMCSDARPARTWQHRFGQHQAVANARAFANDVREIMAQRGLSGTKVGVDIMDAYGFQALEHAGFTIVDADEPIGEAQLIKSPGELAMIRRSVAVAEAALYDFERAIVPGVTENELLATFWHKMLALGGEHCSTRLIASGAKTNPWFYEAGDKIVRPGDLVGIDTDMAGPNGYLCDISRTFLCGDKPTATQREAYSVAYDYVRGVTELCRPGINYRDLVAKAPTVPAAYQELAYSCMVHGDGLDDEPPFLPYAHQKDALIPEGELKVGMVLSVEFYAGKKGAQDGVKLEEQIVVTKDGPVLLSTYPYDAKLLGH